MSFFLLWNIKEDILRNDCLFVLSKTGYHHSSKYLLLCLRLIFGYTIPLRIIFDVNVMFSF